MMKQEGGFFVHILDFVFPKHCVSCRKIGKYFCDECRLLIHVIKKSESICPVCERSAIRGATHLQCRTEYALDGLTCFFHYNGPIRKAVKAIKYRLVSDLADEFVRLIPKRHITRGILIPIPLHPKRFRERGFNQAEVIGKILAKRLNSPMQPDILRRVKETVPQVEMKDRKERLKNMEGVFGVNKTTTQKLKRKTVILFDDVFTTGATMRAAARVLKQAGVKRVWGIAMAR